MKKYSIVIPVYNEAENLRHDFSTFIEWINGFLQRKPELKNEIEVIFAEDGSTDGSYNILKKIQARFECPVKVLHNVDRLGKGGGFRKGFLAAEGSVVILYDCDMAVSPDQIPHLIESIEKGYQIVIASRKHKSTRFLNFPTFTRFVYGQLGYAIAKFLFDFPIQETQCGFKAFKRNSMLPLIKKLDITGWIFDLELILRASLNNLSMLEIPVNYRYVKKSRIHLIFDPIKILYDLFRLRLCVLRNYPVPWLRFTYKRHRFT